MESILVHLQEYEIKKLTSAIYESKEERKIRNGYNQVPHLTQDTTLESDKKYKKTPDTREPRGSPLPADDQRLI